MSMDPNGRKPEQGKNDQDQNGSDQQSGAGKLVKQARSALESRITTISDQENVLQQSRFWMQAVTLGLIGTTVLGIGWLAIARTEEVVVAVRLLAHWTSFGPFLMLAALPASALLGLLA